MSVVQKFSFHTDALAESQRRQSAAANPQHSVWVAASAGTGKTKVLTDRILRLMMDGAKPEEILCLTYTKAAAAEMAGRLVERLTRWVTLPLDDLYRELATIGVENVDASEQTARRLFATVLDCAGGLKIQTLHSFCQSVLARFPLESGLSPNFTVLEDARAAALRAAAFNALVTSPEKAVAAALRALHVTVGEHNLRNVLVADSAAEFTAATSDKLAAALNVAAGIPADDYYRQIVEGVDEVALKTWVRACIDSGAKKASTFGQRVESVLVLPVQKRDGRTYAALLFNNKCELYDKGTAAPKTVAALLPNAYEIYCAEAERVAALLQQAQRAEIAELTTCYTLLRATLDAHYTRAKRTLGVVDYADLIKLTEKLLTTGGNAAWVMYKLDHQIRHILVDEAQDTSPAQWHILQALAAEFTAGEGAQNAARTLFVVGDEKQSIYSFNGADPDGFVRERDAYQQRFQQAQMGFDIVPLTYSFRSTSAVLQLANNLFADDVVRRGVSADWMEHLPARSNDIGAVELWPLLKNDDNEKEGASGWVLSAERTQQTHGNIRLARAIAAQIDGWLQTGAKLESQGRPIVPQDIMILVQRRGVFMQQLVRALKEKNIPIAGVDRLTLVEQLAVQDMMALAQFVLLPDDDLNLAALLKSPLIGFDEQQLFDVCHARRGSVWAALRESRHTAVVDYLGKAILRAAMRPYDFLQAVLRDDCAAGGTGWHAFRARMGGEVTDPLNELLNEALSFEADHTPVLQGFMRHLNESTLQKKRELSQASGEVRVMTVHAAKGLQAPIVFLADAAAPARTEKIPRVLGDADDKTAPSFYVPSSSYATPEVDARRTAHRQSVMEEYRRLMYVAVTRAEDRLIVCGIEHSKNTNRTPANNWYAAVEQALRRMGAAERDGGLYYHYAAGAPVAAQAEVTVKAQAALPVWAAKTAPAEPVPARPLSPSKLMQVDAPVQPPFATTDSQRFAAGVLTHKLLEVLPEIPLVQRAAAMHKICAAFEDEISAERMHAAQHEVEKILNDEIFAPLFGPNSMAEVPLAGLVNGHAISGQIDRLLVTDDAVMIVDYKTNRPPPVNVADVPEGYIRQLACYAAVLRNIYPERRIACALLWTDTPRLMPIPPELLNA